MESEAATNTSDNHPTTQEEAINRCIKNLIHAAACFEENCTHPYCFKLQKVIQHIYNCKKGLRMQCQACTKIFAVLNYHALQCKENGDGCVMPYCGELREKILEKRNKEELENLGGLHQFENLDDLLDLTDFN